MGVTIATIFSILWKGMDSAVPGPWEADGRHARGKHETRVLAGSTTCLLNRGPGYLAVVFGVSSRNESPSPPQSHPFLPRQSGVLEVLQPMGEWDPGKRP